MGRTHGHTIHRLAMAAALALASAAPLALAQHASDNPVVSADDAFGLTLGLESTGIYNPGGVRGFNPQAAGNVRIDGLYFDQQGGLSNRVIESSTIRVGINEIDYAFPAPTGIVDYDLRHATDGKPTATVIAQAGPFDVRSVSVDGSLPIVSRELQLPIGLAVQTGGPPTSGTGAEPGYTANIVNFGATPQWSPSERLTVRGLFDWQNITHQDTLPTVFTAGDFLPPHVDHVFLGQDWAKGRSLTENYGGTLVAKLSTHWSLSAGVFRSIADNPESFADLYVNTEPSGAADHLLVSSPDQYTASTSGEARLTGHLQEDGWYQNLVLMVRGRDEHARYGGADVVDAGLANIGGGVQVPVPEFAYGELTDDHTRIWSTGVAYQGRRAGLGEISFGVQKEHYDKAVETPGEGQSSLSADPWRFYGNASALLFDHLTAYAGYTQGFEDSGIAPSTAANRGTILPTTHTWQADAGLRYAVTQKLTLIAGVFELNRPYFNFDLENVDRQLGVQHATGVELSIAGELLPGLSINGGGLFGQVRVSGPDLAAEGVGGYALGQPRNQYLVNLNYELPKWRALSVDFGVYHFGTVPAAVNDAYYDNAVTVLNLGARYKFTLLGAPATLRVQGQNLANVYFWNIGFSPGFFEFPPRSAVAYVTVDLS
jgi:iron complex outermembrane recepter protein